MNQDHEAHQIIGDIDNAIIHTSSPVVRQALEKAGLSSEEAISLLESSKNQINHLIDSGSSQANYFSPRQPIDQQFDAILDTVSKFHTDPDRSKHLTAYSQVISEIFSNFLQSPEQLILWLEDAKQTAQIDGHNRMADGIDIVISSLTTSGKTQT
ncbi:hypothetical protein ACQ4M3_35190 [Leptolyngbya sp. AN03gr2]|uniref:hypothetical protein n=1 Tax=unclassified Leptolyngbya TaxID=2650499 RepID=UPI003D31F740